MMQDRWAKPLAAAILSALASKAAADTQGSAPAQFPIELAEVPIDPARLQGGAHHAQDISMDAMMGSRVVFDCLACDAPTQSLVSVRQESQGETFFFTADPTAHAQNVEDYCNTVAQDCKVHLVETDGLKGYGYTAMWDGQHLVEHSYFASGLVFVVSAQTDTAETAAANHAYLLDITIPYVTGDTQ